MSGVDEEMEDRELRLEVGVEKGFFDGDEEVAAVVLVLEGDLWWVCEAGLRR